MKRKLIAVLFISVSVFLFVIGIGIIIKPYIVENQREQIASSAYEVISEQISQIPFEAESVISNPTIVVDPDAFEISGEFDTLTSEELSEMHDYIDSLDSSYTLTCVGLLDIPSCDISVAVWDEASVVSLRYGAGLYEWSNLPQQHGNTAILAHYMRREESMFHNLSRIESGDEIIFTNIHGQVFTYRASSILIIDYEDLLPYLVSEEGTEDRITLVTCHYTDEGKKRLVVIGYLEN